jgi:hypothetical protein
MEVTMRTVKQLIAIGFAITAAIVGAGAVGIGAVEHSATQFTNDRFPPSKADFRLNDHQRLRKMLLGQESINLPCDNGRTRDYWSVRQATRCGTKVRAIGSARLPVAALSRV